LTAGLVADHRGRFGSFATLPLPDVAASVAEITFALDHLGLDLRALLGITDPSRVLYGSDWPFTSAPGVELMRHALDNGTVFDRTQLDDIYRNNARRLLVRSHSPM
jgi:hypothetical protein